MPQPLRFNLWQFLDNHITQEDAIPDIRLANLYPSEASVEYTDAHGDKVVLGSCQRQTWLRVKTMEATATARGKEFSLQNIDGDTIPIKPNKFNAKTMWIFGAGNKFEDMVKEKMTAAGVMACSHKRFFRPIRYGYNLSGELDAIGRDPINDEVFGIEIKSAYGYMAETEIIGNKGMRSAGLKGKPKPQNVLQAAIYDSVWPELPYFKLMYILRDSVLKAEFDISVDQTTQQIFIDGEPIKEYNMNDVFARYEGLALNLHNNTFPGRDYQLVYSNAKMNKMVKTGKLSKTNKDKWTKYWDREETIKATGKGRKLMRPKLGDWQCSYCNYKNLCYDSEGHNRDLELMGYNA